MLDLDLMRKVILYIENNPINVYLPVHYANSEGRKIVQGENAEEIVKPYLEYLSKMGAFEKDNKGYSRVVFNMYIGQKIVSLIRDDEEWLKIKSWAEEQRVNDFSIIILKWEAFKFMKPTEVVQNFSSANIGQLNNNTGAGIINTGNISVSQALQNTGANLEELLQAISDILIEVQNSNLESVQKINVIRDIGNGQDEIQEEEPRKSKIEIAIDTMNNIGRLAEAGTMMVGNVAGFITKIAFITAGMGALL